MFLGSVTNKMAIVNRYSTVVRKNFAVAISSTIEAQKQSFTTRIAFQDTQHLYRKRKIAEREIRAIPYQSKARSISFLEFRKNNEPRLPNSPPSHTSKY